MYTIFANEKLGMPVEQVRLAAIRQQIEAQRLGDAVKGNRFGIKSLKHVVLRFIPARKAALPTEVTKHRLSQLETQTHRLHNKV